MCTCTYMSQSRQCARNTMRVQSSARMCSINRVRATQRACKTAGAYIYPQRKPNSGCTHNTTQRKQRVCIHIRRKSNNTRRVCQTQRTAVHIYGTTEPTRAQGQRACKIARMYAYMRRKLNSARTTANTHEKQTARVYIRRKTNSACIYIRHKANSQYIH